METILLLDDHPTSLQVLTAVLRDLGQYTVIEARDEQQAVAACQQHTGPIHLVVADVLLRGASGVNIVSKLRDMRTGIPALFVSGSALQDLADKGIFIPVGSFLQKPFLPKTFLQAVRKALDSSPARRSATA